MVPPMTEAPGILPAQGWGELLARLERGTVMVVGERGTGKSALARYLLGQLARGGDPRGGRAALIDCNLDRNTVGVPGCLALALTAPWEAPAALWFVGATSPEERLLPAVVGACHLVERARTAGARAVILDTSPLVHGPAGRALKLHKAVAARVDQVVAIQRGDELEPLLTLLAAGGRAIHRLAPSPRARPGTPAQRRAHREGRFRAHLAGAETRLFSRRRFVGPAWEVGPGGNGAANGGSGNGSGSGNGHHGPAPGTVVGLIDEGGCCLGLGLIEEVHADRVAVSTAVARREVARLQVGGFRLAEDGTEPES
jgi:polynucleotide 5'-kinase involved in rRNA processing